MSPLTASVTLLGCSLCLSWRCTHVKNGGNDQMAGKTNPDGLLIALRGVAGLSRGASLGARDGPAADGTLTKLLDACENDMM